MASTIVAKFTPGMVSMIAAAGMGMPGMVYETILDNTTTMPMMPVKITMAFKSRFQSVSAMFWGNGCTRRGQWNAVLYNMYIFLHISS